MRALIQRVSEASVGLDDGTIVGQINYGLLIFLGIGLSDTITDAEYLANKIAGLRIFPDDRGKMNRNVKDVGGQVLIVPQFTLYGETRKGNRPSYSSAARPDRAEPLYESFVRLCREIRLIVATGVFQAHMTVRLVNDGPVTLWCRSESELHYH